MIVQHTTSTPFQFTSGPHSAKIMLVGEAWGEEEEKWKAPFIGSSGQELTRMLEEAGIHRKDCLLTNVFPFRPPSNNIKFLCGSKLEMPSGYKASAITPGYYVKPEYLGEVDRLKEEIATCRPNLVVLLGNTAAWAVLGKPGISAIRGTISLVGEQKVLPTFHPASVLYNWSQRGIVISDLLKAAREATFPELRRPERWILINPTLNEIATWFYHYAATTSTLSFDIETGAGQIKCVGFGASASQALVIPFVDLSKESGSYWNTVWEEALAWDWVEKLLQLPCPKIAQNGLYDLQYLYRAGIYPRNCTEDTMLLHHSLYPEMQKGLGFLGSVYTNEQSWKIMRAEAESNKRDE